MKVLKIVVGFFLILGSGAEYINASKQLLTFLDPGIIFASLAMIFISAFLIASGFSKEKIEIRSWKFAIYYILSIFMFLLVAFVNLFTYKFEPETVTVNGVNVNIAEFMNGSKRIIPDENERRSYCVCVVTKLTQNENIADNYSQEFKEGKIDRILNELKSDTSFYTLKLNECAGLLTSLQWTPEFEKGIRENIMWQLKESEYAKTNDLDKYCNCLIEEYKKLPIKEMSNSEFYLSKKNLEIDSICVLKSKLK